MVGVLDALPELEQFHARRQVLRRVIGFHPEVVVAHEPVLELALAGQVPSGEVDHAVDVVEIVHRHRPDRQRAPVEPLEQLVADVLRAAFAGHAVAVVVGVHDLERLGEGGEGVAVADGGEEQRKVAGAVGEDAQVRADHLPPDPQAATPGVDLGESVVREGIGKGLKAVIEGGLIRESDRIQAKTQQGVIVHTSYGFLRKTLRRPAENPNARVAPADRRRGEADLVMRSGKRGLHRGRQNTGHPLPWFSPMFNLSISTFRGKCEQSSVTLCA